MSSDNAGMTQCLASSTHLFFPTNSHEMMEVQASFAMHALAVRKGDAAFLIRLNLPSRLSRAMRQEGAKGAQQYPDDIFAMDRALATQALTRL